MSRVVETKTTFICPACKHQYSSFKGLCVHFRRKHDKDDIQIIKDQQNIKHICFFCQKPLSSKTSLSRHYMTCKRKNTCDNSQLYEQEIKHLQERLKDKEDFVKYVQTSNHVLNNNNNNTTNNKITNNINISLDTLTPITNKWLQELFAHVAEENYNISSPDDIVRIMEYHGLNERLHLNDSSRLKMSWKDGDNNNILVKDIRGSQLSKKTKDACYDQLIEYKQYLVNKMKHLDVMSDEFKTCGEKVNCFDAMRVADNKTLDDFGVSLVKSVARGTKNQVKYEKDILSMTYDEIKSLYSLDNFFDKIEAFIKKDLHLFILSNQNNMSCQLANACDGLIERDSTKMDHFIIMNEHNIVVQIPSIKLNECLHHIISSMLPSKEIVMHDILSDAFNDKIDKTRYFYSMEEFSDNMKMNIDYFFNPFSHNDDTIIDLTYMFEGRIKK